MSAAMHNVTATPRPSRGKGAARRLRNEGRIPAVAYGKDLAAVPLAVTPKDILAVLKSERGQNTVLQMQVESGNGFLAMIKDYSVHPVARTLEHVDFVEVKLDRPVDVEIPLVGTGKPAGIAQGGILRQVYRTVPVRCLPDRIPLKIEVDISHLELGDSLHANKLPVAEGVEVRLAPEQTVIAVVAPEKDRGADEAAAAPGAPGAAAAAAPAAGGKAPAAAAGKAAAAPAKDAGKDAKKK